jgi:uncharacterized protein (DUF1810 family)
MKSKYNLNRFIDAQKYIYEQVISELSNGNKQTHWMWFIFPQINGLGRSSIAELYSIKNKEEAIAYLENPILGKKIRECTEIILNINGKTASQIFGFPDDMKLKSSMTLFAYISDSHSIFHRVLDKYFDGKEDKKTLDLLQ